MSTEADKAIAACVAYAKAHGEVQRLTRVIGEALVSCINDHLERYADWNTDSGEYPPEWVSHLKEAYSSNGDDEWGGYMEPEDQEELLAEKCPHCLAAHQAIQQRKVARKAFGAAKRFVGGIGRRASTNPNKEAPTP